jgi:hypothetical protein
MVKMLPFMWGHRQAKMIILFLSLFLGGIQYSRALFQPFQITSVTQTFLAEAGCNSSSS